MHACANSGLADLIACAHMIHTNRCHRVLAEVALGRGDTQEAERELRVAHEESSVSGFDFIAMLCARDLKTMVLDRDGRGAEGDAMIDGACAAMGKQRAQFVGVVL